MTVAGYGKLVGFRHGTKNGKRWGNIYIDNPENPMERLQVFVRDDIFPAVEALPIPSDVQVCFSVYTMNSGKDQAIRLNSIALKK